MMGWRSTLETAKELFWDSRNVFGKVALSWCWIVVLIMCVLELIMELTEKKPKAKK